MGRPAKEAADYRPQKGRIMSREILKLSRRDDGIFEIYGDGILVEEYEANEDTS